MQRRRWMIPTLALAVAGATGCARELDLDPTVDPNDLGVVVAQFDPTNPVGVLQLVPSPTALAQNPDGTLNQEAVAPEPCELPTEAQCLQFVDGWPLTTPVTLYFSGPIDGSTIESGIKVYEVAPAGGDVQLTEVPVVPICPGQPDGMCPDQSRPYIQRPRPRPECMTDENGNTRYTEAEIPPGIQVTLAPTRPLMPGTQYLVKVVSSESGGLRDEDGQLIEPSALFSLLNVPPEAEPITEDGKIQSALLRSQVVGTILARDFDNQPLAELDDSQRAQFDMTLEATGLQLRGLYELFDGVGSLLMSKGELGDRREAVFLNSWTTGSDPTVLEFDPANDKFPFPNVPLMTVPTSTGSLTELMVNLPEDPEDTPTSAALKRGLNTLDGFSNTAPIAMTFSKNIDPATLQGNVLMYALNDQNAIQGEVPVIATFTASTSEAPPTLTVRPAVPLDQDALYVVAVTSGIQDEDGNPVQAASTFSLLRDVDQPFIDESDTVLPAVEPALQCSTVQATGSLADDSTVRANARALEEQVGHQRWTPAFEALQGANPPIQREDILMAFHYKTQTITETVDTAKQVLLPNVWEQLDGNPRLMGPAFSATTSAAIADLIGLVPNFCVGFCMAGAMAPDVAPNECVDEMGNINPDVPDHLVCQLARQIIVGNLGRADLYLMKSYKATTGNPFAGGTFTPDTVMTPEINYIPIWVIEPAGTPPAGGFPTVIFQHGLGQQKEDGFLLANTMANTGMGWATVMMDFPFHGARASDLIDNATGVPCVDGNGLPNVDPADVVCDPSTGMCQGGCDGMQDPSATGLLSSNLFGVRDNFRQGTIDQLTLIRTLQEEGKAGGALDKLDGTRLGYIGQSLGGIAGGNLAAYAGPNDLESLVINVGGGSLITILLNTVPQISAPLFGALAQAGVCDLVEPGNPASGCKDTAAFRQFLLIAQWVLDPGDPYGTSIGVVGQDRPGLDLGPDKVLIQMSRPDLVVNNQATLLLGLSYGRDLDLTMMPFASNDDRFQIYDFSELGEATMGSGCHGWLLAPTCGRVDMNGAPDLPDVLCNTIGAQQQAAGFIDSSGDNVPPQRPAQVSGIPCP